MREKSCIIRPGALALVLTLMITYLIEETLAKFVTEVEGGAEAIVVAWEFEITGNSRAALSSIDMRRTAYKGEAIGDNVIAPGVQRSSDIALDGTSSDVGIDYTVTVGESPEPDMSDLPDDLVFQVDGTNYSSGNEVEGKIEHAVRDDAMKGTITVSWKQDYGSTDTAEADKNGNRYTGESWKLKIKTTGTQTKPTEATAPIA